MTLTRFPTEKILKPGVLFFSPAVLFSLMITPCDPLSIDVGKSDVTRSSLFQSLSLNSGKSLDDLSQLFIFRMRPNGLIKLIDYFYVCVAAWRESGMMMMN